MTDGARLIAEERDRQINDEGFNSEKDDTYTYLQLARAANCYLRVYIDKITRISNVWPWPREFWKPAGSKKDLVKAGGLIAAELDRLLRIERYNEALLEEANALLQEEAE